MNKRELNFDCFHNTAEHIMTCSWLDGRVELVHHFNEHTSAVKIDGEVKDIYRGLSIPEFERLQEHCQDVADRIKRDIKTLREAATRFWDGIAKSAQELHL